MPSFNFTSQLWRYEGPAAWHFVTLPPEEAQVLKEALGNLSRAWGSLGVTAQIGQSTWRTSVFWTSGKQSFDLPVKAAIMKREGLDVGEQIAVTLHFE